MTTTRQGRVGPRAWRLAAATALAVALLPQTGAAGATDPDGGLLRAVALTAEHLTDPLGIDTATPRLSWLDSSNVNGAAQTAYEVAVSTAARGSGTVWESGKVDSARSYDVGYAGPPLRSRTRYRWTVRVWDNRGHASPWSRSAWFETAFLDPAAFQGAWIGRRAAAGETTPNPLLRKEFPLHGGITSARAYVSGLGFHQLYVNGHRIGDHVLDPAFTNYDRTVDYVTYDVTADVRAGRNAVGVGLGNGWYAGNADHFSVPEAVPWQPARPELKFQLTVRYADGSSAQVVSDTGWVTADGPTTADDVQSETYDARLVRPGWTSPGYAANGWTPAVTVPAPTGVLRAQSIPPVRRTATTRPVAATEPRSGVTVYDFGTTTSGWARITMLGASGTSVRIRYAERLNPDGTAEDENGQTDVYTLRGGGPETYEPSWGWKGYRYVQVSAAAAPPRILSARGVAVHTALASTGDFHSSSALFDTMHDAMRRTILNNQYSFGTDTPVYEKGGWTADNRLIAIAAMSNFDMQAYTEKWMRDFTDDQYPDGSLPLIVPSPATCTTAPFPVCADWHVTEPVWESADILMHTYLYTYYGDLWSVRRDYGTMAAWLNKVESEISTTGYLYQGFTFGDWSVPTNSVAPSSQLIGSMFVHESAAELARLATLLGEAAGARHYQQLADAVRTAVTSRFYDPARHVFRDPPGTAPEPGGYSQTANLLGLAFGLAPARDRRAIVANLVADVAAKGNHLATGANGSQWILPVLTEAGYGDLAYQIATNPTYPGWGHWFEQCGATTMWEAWECDTARSHDHAFMGTIDDWFFTHLAGIQPTGPAFRTIRVKPYPVGDLTTASADQTTPLGRVSSSWRRSGHTFDLTVRIPVGATAQIHVPAAEPASVRTHGGATFTGTQDCCAVYTVRSGTYAFQSTM
ncbi:family 78 glycoside hydrolase catalytic domain [Actinophytocola sp.]|uniref:family 78 glycoside hydrolase catalytic domain n=1 Tax=Actinophytocola sp. TaxID=1872138 RepID=UPI003899EC8C